jgi:RHS repeat-associated protein
LTRAVTRWYVYDGLGSVIAELDDNNNMTTSGQYDVYGLPRAGTRQGVSPTSSQGYVGSLGHMTDASTGGLIYMQARYYDPGLGRFVSEDPKQNGNNLITYCNDCPTCEADQTGECPLEVAAVILAAIIGGILECINHGWSFKNFMLGAVMAGLTAAAGIFIPTVLGIAFGGIIMGAAMGALDAEIQGGNVGSGAFWGALGGGVGGLAGEAELAEGAEQMLCYLLIGGDEAFLQNDGQNILEFVNS